MYRTIEDFLKTWGYESKATLKMLDALTDASLSQTVAPGGRSLGRLAWHLGETNCEMMTRAGLTVEGVEENSPAPESAAAIREAYAKSAAAVAEQVGARWKDAELADEIELYYGRKFAKGAILSMLVHHQTHHRGQMTVLMRQAGLRVPGVYGPAKEEWEAFGMPPKQ